MKIRHELCTWCGHLLYPGTEMSVDLDGLGGLFFVCSHGCSEMLRADHEMGDDGI